MGISSGQLCTMISLAILSGAASVAYDQPTRLLTPPANFERVEQATSYDWCACGVQSLKVNGLDITSNNATFLLFDSPITKISWVCGNESTEHHKSLLSPSVLVSIKFTLEKKSWPCSKMSARLRWNTWRSSNKTVYKTTSTPFSSMQSGYACVKIPVLLRTKNGTLLVFAEARKDNCSDFARTDLLVRRSTDEGQTFSPFQLLANPGSGPHSLGVCGNPLVVGNAAPVQLPADSPYYPGRILVPHMHNNYEVFQVHSDDDGLTWSPPRPLPNLTIKAPEGPDCYRNLSYFGIGDNTSYLQWLEEVIWDTKDPYQQWRDKLTGPWQFVGTGPPGSIVTKRGARKGRVLVPAYHSYIRGRDSATAGAGVGLPISQLYNNFALGHILVSDDGGDTYTLSASRLGALHGANEAQLVELRNGSILVNSRSFSTGTPQYRVQAMSHDQGITFTPTQFVRDLAEPFSGCEGSVVASPDGTRIYYAHTNALPNRGIAPWVVKALGGKVNLTGRDHMTVWESVDQGRSYRVLRVLDEGPSGYVSMQVTASTLYVLYEQSDQEAQTLSELGIEALIGHLTVMDPDRLVLRVIDLPT